MKLNILDRSQSTYTSQETSVIPQDNNIQIRTLESKEDAIDVIKCLYDAYGYSYCYEKMYYDDSLIELNNSKKIKTFILKNDHNQTAGTFSLFFTAEYLNMPEIGTVIVCKEFRKLHLAKDLIARGIEEARKVGSSAVMVRPVDFHSATQKVCNGYGMIPTAFIFEYVDTEMAAEYSSEKSRFDVCCCVKLFERTEKRILYPPKRIINFTESIYKKLGANYEISSDDEIEAFTLSSVDTNHRLLTTKIIVTQAGKNFERLLTGCVNSAILNKHEMIELSLNMFFSGCDYAFEIARKKGFTFSGIIPGSTLGDYIIMQMLPGKGVDYNRPVLTDGYIELLEEIKQINVEIES